VCVNIEVVYEDQLAVRSPTDLALFRFFASFVVLHYTKNNTKCTPTHRNGNSIKNTPEAQLWAISNGICARHLLHTSKQKCLLEEGGGRREKGGGWREEEEPNDSFDAPRPGSSGGADTSRTPP